MKMRYVLVLCCLLATISPTPSSAEGALHIFTTTDGRSLNAVITDYNDRTGKISIEREDGKEVKTLPTVFCEADQEYVRQWIAVDQFMSPTKFKIKGNKTKDETSMHGTGGYQYSSKRVTHESNVRINYEITFENKTDFPINDLRIEYRAFILNEGKKDLPDSSRIDGGQFEIAEIPVGEKVSKKAKTLDLVTRFMTQTDSDSFGNTTSYQLKICEEDLEGFWIKVYGPMLDGKPVIREWCNPPDTSEDFAWQDITRSNDRVTGTSKPATRKKDSYGIGPNSLAKTDPDNALELMHAKYEKDGDPELAKNIGYTYVWYLKPRDVDTGLDWLKKGAEKDNVSACSLLAGIYSSYYPGLNKYRNVELALHYGNKLLDLGRSDALPHQCIALAYAHAGQFDKAVEHQETLIAIYEDMIEKAKGKDEYQKRLRNILTKEREKLVLYRNNKVK